MAATDDLATDASDGPPPLPTFTDLRALAESLPKDGRFSGVASAIRKAVRAQSCAADLRQAQSCVDALTKLTQTLRGYKTLERGATESALLMQAIQLYARATDLETKRGDRGSVSIKTRFNADQLQDHDALVTLRNRVGAHVYVGERIAGEVWNGDLLFAVKTAQGWLPASASHVMQFDVPTFQRLQRQVPAALTLMVARFQEHFAVMTAKLHMGGVPEQLFCRHQFNPVGLLGTEQEVRATVTDQPWASRSTLAVYPRNTRR